MNEFELIRHYFDRRQSVPGVIVGVGDDGAVLAPDPNTDQCQVIDTLVEGVHFPVGTDPADIAYRSVVVNLSDIAAMGGRPRWMTLALTLTDASESWLGAFSSGLFAAADKYNVVLVGGDTTRGDSVVVTIAMSGEVEKGCALLRSGATPGDTIFVTGTPGDAAAGLALLQQREANEYLVGRFLRPTPRLETGRKLVGKASAVIDISDGLVGDLGKLLRASGAGAEISIDRLPLSDALRARFDVDKQRRFALTGGDDYELCFAANADSVVELAGITAIGKVTESTALLCLLNGDVVEVDDSGYRHF